MKNFTKQNVYSVKADGFYELKYRCLDIENDEAIFMLDNISLDNGTIDYSTSPYFFTILDHGTMVKGRIYEDSYGQHCAIGANDGCGFTISACNEI